MTDTTSRLYVPAFGGIYRATHALAEPILRVVLGVVLMPHGAQKLFGLFGGAGFTANAQLFDKIGFTPGIFWGTLVGCTEFFGGMLLVLGLFTRFAAAAVLIFMLVAMWVTSHNGGFFWTKQGMEYSLLIGACALFFLIRGGGACSLDHTIGREI
jgi:putative oxidoreductase